MIQRSIGDLQTLSFHASWVSNRSVVYCFGNFEVLAIYVEVRELCEEIKLLSNAHVHRMCMEKIAKEVV
jgi:hypothetical protein